MVVRFLNALNCVQNWLIQRITALLMALYTLFILAYLLLHPSLNYTGWQKLFALWPMRVLSLLFLLSLFLHAWVGMRDIFMDYVHTPVIRHSLNGVVALALMVYTIWSVHILWGGR